MQNEFNITDHFFLAAKNYPDRLAIVKNEDRITFGELAEQVKEAAAYFRSKGLSKGDRVLVFVPMNLDLYRIVLALFYIGATAVFMDEWVSKRRMEECCKVAQCKGFVGIFKARILGWFSSELRKIPIKTGSKIQKINQGDFEPAATVRTDTALITFTTGSTGIPKAAKRTHGFLDAQFKALIEKIEPTNGDVDMPVLPIVLLINLGLGSTSVIADFKASKPKTIEPEKIAALMKKEKVNRMVSSPFFLKQISGYIADQKIAFPDLKKIFTGGAPVFQSEASLYKIAFPNTRVEIVYGSTEAEPISGILAEELIVASTKERGLCVGQIYHATQTHIIGITEEAITCSSAEEFSKLILAHGEIGEIVVSGDHVLSEYFNNDEALRRNKIFFEKECWHRTGDSGYFDSSARLFLTGRCSNLIYKGGQIISPFMQENLLMSISGVEMGTVLEMGLQIVAVVELHSGMEQSRVEARVNKICPEVSKVHFIAEMPRDPRHHSKIDYGRLRQQLNKG
jgi:olefin beta-lactone synthetase